MMEAFMNNATARKMKPIPRRTASKETRRLQLIRATIKSIARNGLSDTTIATVSSEAKLSQGIINLHFQSKERLLIETLRHVADVYKDTWETALANAGPSSAEKLQDLVNVDFDKSVFDRNQIAVWFAFWSETKSRPTYRKLCAERDRGYEKVLTGLVAEIIEEGNYGPLDPAVVASGLAAITQGLWLDLLVSPRSMNREKAYGISQTYLACLFPKHFKNTTKLES
jgi:TetR/AcrR family transcriptional repressor of bet genes